jgi:hypothetical protein
MGKLPARMSRSLPKLCSPLVCALVCLLLAACGSSKTPVRDENNTGANGINSTPITLGSLEYQVAISRTLNPSDVEDASYLAGIPAAQRNPPVGQTWLGVFLNVNNNSKQSATPATVISLADTQGNTYTPVQLPDLNQFAYRPLAIPPGASIPFQDSVASSGPTEAALLLFKIPISSFDNRPLVLTIADPSDQATKGKVTLDV